MINLRKKIKQFLPRTLFGRSLLIIIMPLILLQIVSAWIFYDRHWDTITRRLAGSIAGDISNVLLQMQRQPDLTETILLQAKATMDLDMTLLPDAILPNAEKPFIGRIDRPLSRALNYSVNLPHRINSQSFKERVVIDLQLANGVLNIIVPGKRIFSSTTYIFITWMMCTSLVLCVVASIFMRNQIRPILRLGAAASSFGKGREIDYTLKLEGAHEIRQATNSFNLMADRVRRQMRQRTDMLSGVSHDLRTPITRMKLQLALVDETPEIVDLKENLTTMEKMIEGYLTFARGEGGEATIQTDLGKIVTSEVSKFQRAGIDIKSQIQGEIPAWLKVDAIERSINNLISNAHHYAHNIWVTAQKSGNFIEVIVDDDGPGIPEKQRNEAFRPFVRLDQSRNAETGGTGLGLTIARDVARVHGGDLFLETSPHGGLRARIHLPL